MPRAVSVLTIAAAATFALAAVSPAASVPPPFPLPVAFGTATAQGIGKHTTTHTVDGTVYLCDNLGEYLATWSDDNNLGRISGVDGRQEADSPSACDGPGSQVLAPQCTTGSRLGCPALSDTVANCVRELSSRIVCTETIVQGTTTTWLSWILQPTGRFFFRADSFDNTVVLHSGPCSNAEILAGLCDFERVIGDFQRMNA